LFCFVWPFFWTRLFGNVCSKVFSSFLHQKHIIRTNLCFASENKPCRYKGSLFRCLPVQTWLQNVCSHGPKLWFQYFSFLPRKHTFFERGWCRVVELIPSALTPLFLKLETLVLVLQPFLQRCVFPSRNKSFPSRNLGFGLFWQPETNVSPLSQNACFSYFFLQKQTFLIRVSLFPPPDGAPRPTRCESFKTNRFSLSKETFETRVWVPLVASLLAAFCFWFGFLSAEELHHHLINRPRALFPAPARWSCAELWGRIRISLHRPFNHRRGRGSWNQTWPAGKSLN